MACCCKARCCRISAVCLGRCDLPKHKCLDKEEVKPGPVPKNMGWLYTAKDAPQHQLRCGWRPGHITGTVLRKFAEHRGKCGRCPGTCTGTCSNPKVNPCGMPPKCSAPAQEKKKNKEVVAHSKSEPYNPGSNKFEQNKSHPSKSDYSSDPKKSDLSKSEPYKNEPCKPEPCRLEPCCTTEPSTPYLRVIRHAGRYSIITDPPDNSPSGPYPLKYVLNCDPNDKDEDVKFSLEAKYNDYCFDYTSSQTSFVLDFSPPDQRCYKPCPKDPCNNPCTPICLAPC